MLNKVYPFARNQNPKTWDHANCRLCPKAYKPEPGELVTMERTVQLVTSGQECRHKGFLDHFTATAEVPQSIAEELGWRGKDKGLPDRCPLRPWADQNPPRQGSLFGKSSTTYRE